MHGSSITAIIYWIIIGIVTGKLIGYEQSIITSIAVILSGFISISEIMIFVEMSKNITKNCKVSAKILEELKR